jgi:hypothetical protein
MKVVIKQGMVFFLGILAATVIGCSSPSTNNSDSGSNSAGAKAQIIEPVVESGGTTEITAIEKKPEMAPTETAVSADNSDMPIKTGLSSPKPRGGKFEHDVTTDLKVRVWVVSNLKSKAVLSINGTEYPLVKEFRPDLNKLYEAYTFRDAYHAIVPGADLKQEDNHFIFSVNGEVYEDHTLSLK